MIGETSPEQIEKVIERAIHVSTKYSQIIDGTITSVDPVNLVCSVHAGDDNGSADFDNVALRVLMGTKGAYVEMPIVGTDCIMGWRSNQNGRRQLYWAQDYDTIEVTVQTSYKVSSVKGGSIELTDKVSVNGGNNGGVPLSQEATNRLNLIENKVNDLINAFNSHIHPGVQSGAGSTAITTTPITGTLTPTQETDIENTKFLQ